MRRSSLLACVLLATSAAVGALTEEEQRERILYEANQGAHSIEETGALYDDAALDAYLQEIVDKLYPERQGELVVRGFSSTPFNAFAMPNGRLYMHIGTLLRLDNEAELAAVLGHEGAHYTQDHIYRWIRSTKVSMPILTVVGAAVGYAALGQIAGYSTVMGMSRDHEREADDVGFARMRQAGYEPRAGAETFRRLLRELKAQKTRQPLFFASHPRVQERIESFERLASAHPGAGETYRERYLNITEKARVAALHEIWKQRDGKLLVFLLETEQRLESLPGYCRFYLAEGYRLRGEQGDAERAVALYREVLSEQPSFAPTYAALGRHEMRAGNEAEALALFRKYLQLDAASPERAFIEHYVATLEEKGL